MISGRNTVTDEEGLIPRMDTFTARGSSGRRKSTRGSGRSGPEARLTRFMATGARSRCSRRAFAEVESGEGQVLGLAEKARVRPA
jgi:hypothetical protein